MTAKWSRWRYLEARFVTILTIRFKGALVPAWPADRSPTRTGPVEADGAVDAQNAPTAPWKTLLVFHELPQGFPHPITHDKPRKSPESYWETRIDPKNGPVLRNLLAWLRSVANGTDKHGRRYLKDICPMLVVDDECDQGSIDTREGAFDEDGNVDEEHDPTTLNRRIRELLELSNRSAYVGYTATPFANIFIHESSRSRDIGEDLFPRSFILSLPTPSNYVGATRIFGGEDANGNPTPGLPITRHATDHAASQSLREREGWMPPLHNKEHTPRFASAIALPPSLQGAIRCFILSTAARKGYIRVCQLMKSANKASSINKLCILAMVSLDCGPWPTSKP